MKSGDYCSLTTFDRFKLMRTLFTKVEFKRVIDLLGDCCFEGVWTGSTAGSGPSRGRYVTEFASIPTLFGASSE
jgi:hypothetical protein